MSAMDVSKLSYIELLENNTIIRLVNTWTRKSAIWIEDGNKREISAFKLPLSIEYGDSVSNHYFITTKESSYGSMFGSLSSSNPHYSLTFIDDYGKIINRCECGAKHTKFMQDHAFWCREYIRLFN